MRIYSRAFSLLSRENLTSVLWLTVIMGFSIVSTVQLFFINLLLCTNIMQMYTTVTKLWTVLWNVVHHIDLDLHSRTSIFRLAVLVCCTKSFSSAKIQEKKPCAARDLISVPLGDSSKIRAFVVMAIPPCEYNVTKQAFKENKAVGIRAFSELF